MRLRKLQGFRPIWALLVALILVLAASAVSACEGTTALEVVYCELMAKGKGDSLPRFDDFRRNPAETQRLLLRRPAAKAGLPLPPASASETSKTKSTLTTTTAVKPARSTRQPTPASAHSAQTYAAAAQVSGDFRDCAITAKAIRCGAKQYLLQDNLANSRLAAGALTDTNQLLLPAVPRDLGNVHDYLRDAYVTYLEKMMDIGLAGVTLTYSKFFYIYEDVSATKGDFPSRFKEMYHYLKKDKASMGVARQHGNSAPPSLAVCEFIADHLIACDNHGSNWIFRQ